MPSSPLLDKLKPEERESPQLRYDWELADVLGRHLTEQSGAGYDDFYSSFRNYLFAVVREVFPAFRARILTDGQSTTCSAASSGSSSWPPGGRRAAGAKAKARAR